MDFTRAAMMERGHLFLNYEERWHIPSSCLPLVAGAPGIPAGPPHTQWWRCAAAASICSSETTIISSEEELLRMGSSPRAARSVGLLSFRTPEKVPLVLCSSVRPRPGPQADASVTRGSVQGGARGCLRARLPGREAPSARGSLGARLPLRASLSGRDASREATVSQKRWPRQLPDSFFTFEPSRPNQQPSTRTAGCACTRAP